MRTREIQCEFYICHGQCRKNKKADFYGICQHCQLYIKKKGALPKRTNNKNIKKEAIVKRELRKECDYNV